MKICLLGASIILSIILVVQDTPRHNWAALATIGELQSARYVYSEAQNAIQVYARDPCQKYWLMGLAAFRQGDQTKQDNEWAASIRCSERYVSAIRAMQPDSRPLAEIAVKYQPTDPESWFWLATTNKESNPVWAIDLMVQGLRLRSRDGVGWYQLAQLYERVGELHSAIDAYISSCAYLNRGTDCYVKVGSIYERLGDIQLAIYYYRLSIYDGAHQRADWLEKQFPP